MNTTPPDFELPLGKRTKFYRFFEMVPAILSYGAFVLLIVLSLVSPLLAAVYLMLILIVLLVRAVGIIYHTLQGHRRLVMAQRVDWAERLAQLENPEVSYEAEKDIKKREFGTVQHLENLRLMAAAAPGTFPKPSELYNMVIIAAYDEPYSVLKPTIESLVASHYDNKQLMIALAYEERGGADMEATAQKLAKEYKNTFLTFQAIKHPRNLPNEVVGKGGNITFAGKKMREWVDKQGIEHRQVIITTLDSDNRPHRSYFDYVTYEYIANEDRKHLAYQPIALFMNNIWDVPAPMRVVATGNTFWNIISSMRPHILRNFASHSQPMDALVEMDFWSTRTVVEDGHHFWRSYFYFNGNYSVHPIYIPIYQDAVLGDSYLKSFKAQFIQLRRWMYGASDVPYVALHVFTKRRRAPFWPGFIWFIRNLDGYVTAASVSIIVAVGGWVPLLLNSHAYRDLVAHQLPDTVSVVQRIALVGIVVMVFLSFKLLPPRPERYKRTRNFWMLVQWVMMPLTAIGFLSFAALNSQARLFLGKYLTKFDVTKKVTVDTQESRLKKKDKTRKK
ncbi:glycosyltransferase family 2 protein [Candidatus Saccharibacteria bacterium TM7i]|nr:glycosyltransferase family 2 protein [Candidatus Saccharibacteria bacterium TM7i]